MWILLLWIAYEHDSYDLWSVMTFVLCCILLDVDFCSLTKWNESFYHISCFELRLWIFISLQWWKWVLFWYIVRNRSYGLIINWLDKSVTFLTAFSQFRVEYWNISCSGFIETHLEYTISHILSHRLNLFLPTNQNWILIHSKQIFHNIPS